MKNCGYEEAVMTAVRSGQWSDELLEHRESCLVCAEVTLVASLLINDAESLDAEEVAIPDPRILWLRASLEKRRNVTLQATQVISWMQRATVVATVGVLAFFAPNLLSMFKGAGYQLLGSLARPDLPATVAGPVLVLFLTFSTLALMALWNEFAERS